jgi:hypothetical protein
MKVEWWKYDCTQEERDERKALVRSAKPTLDVLRKMLEKRLEDIHSRRLSNSLYDSPNWPYMQADLLGSERVLTELVELLTIVDED